MVTLQDKGRPSNKATFVFLCKH